MKICKEDILEEVKSQMNPLYLTPHEDGKYWILLKEFKYELYYIGSGEIIEVPKDTVTDFASIPSCFWNIFPPWEKYGKAAIVHDYLYLSGIYSRKDSDLIMKEIMINSNVNSLTIFFIYSIIRMLGWIFYKEKSHTLKRYDLKKVWIEVEKTKKGTFKILRKILFLILGYSSFVYLVIEKLF